MLGLYVSIAALGAAAIDPIGIGIMPILLLQKSSYKRALVFLSGSFLSLILMGVVLAKGLGRVILRIEHHEHWFIKDVELIAAMILLMIAAAIYIRFKQGKVNVEPTGKARAWLRLGNWHLFVLGFVLVAIQSLLDIVFLVAMVRVGQLKLSALSLIMVIVIYAVAALFAQLIVVAVFWFTPNHHKERAMRKVNELLLKYSSQALIAISLILSGVLIFLAS